MTAINQPDALSSKELQVEEVAALLHLSTSEVLEREQTGEIFSYVCRTESNARRYPLYQFSEEVAPELIQHVGPLLDWSGATLHLFFSSSDPDLANLSVRELLCGQAFAGSTTDESAKWLLSRSADERMKYVLAAAERWRAVVQDWL